MWCRKRLQFDMTADEVQRRKVVYQTKFISYKQLKASRGQVVLWLPCWFELARAKYACGLKLGRTLMVVW